MTSKRIYDAIVIGTYLLLIRDISENNYFNFINNSPPLPQAVVLLAVPLHMHLNNVD